MTLVALEVGKPWPYPLAGDGLQAAIDPAEQGLSLTLVAAVGRPTPSEIAAHGARRGAALQADHGAGGVVPGSGVLRGMGRRNMTARCDAPAQHHDVKQHSAPRAT